MMGRRGVSEARRRFGGGARGRGRMGVTDNE